MRVSSFVFVNCFFNRVRLAVRRIDSDWVIPLGEVRAVEFFLFENHFYFHIVPFFQSAYGSGLTLPAEVLKLFCNLLVGEVADGNSGLLAFDPLAGPGGGEAFHDRLSVASWRAVRAGVPSSEPDAFLEAFLELSLARLLELLIGLRTRGVVVAGGEAD